MSRLYLQLMAKVEPPPAVQDPVMPVYRAEQVNIATINLKINVINDS